LHEQRKDIEIHFATKKTYSSLLVHHPNIAGVHCLNNDWNAFVDLLKKESFDLIIDLHNNLRTRRLAIQLGVKRKAFKKLNIAKWLVVNTKVNKLPEIHIVDRYINTLSGLGVTNDHRGLELYLPTVLNDHFLEELPPTFIGFAIGGQHHTKKLPKDMIADLLDKIQIPIVLVGGPEDQQIGEELSQGRKHVFNYCGKLDLLQSAKLIKSSHAVITHDTGMMHIASAYKKDVISIWGNTIPEFGMYPYQSGEGSEMFEVKDLSCRPCSKIGYNECPKGHFKCMRTQNLEAIAEKALMLFGKE